MTQRKPGKLWIVATPIGNLDDMSARARRVLGDVDLIAAEDTRHSVALLRHCGIATRTLALHEHNERERADELVARMRDEGLQIALISDAGTPLISDPGFRLVRAAREAGIEVCPVPGACAAIAALSAAGLASDRFVFEGFLPAKAGQRRSRLQVLAGESRTLILYESSHRILEALQAMAEQFGEERPALLARELTKLHETFIGDTLGTILARVRGDANQQRGEFVIVVAGTSDDDEAQREREGRRVFELLRGELPPGRAAKLAAAITGAPRKRLYPDQ